ncbi:hypothetical protein Vretimale_2426 [Volvox reticuliferus]|uniref:Uncharacterized protein n=1 Tax=Volvox reticuliferus TaxID=1737510 RepID=A0A8J4DCY3_9CHLO|nr:hypothetical protein Vretifemale_4621 [Volvox reticuliferus]GIL96666.1 hypothetical protein Vretimale_2426 [Volvox reticuliferus]
MEITNLEGPFRLPCDSRKRSRASGAEYFNEHDHLARETICEKILENSDCYFLSGGRGRPHNSCPSARAAVVGREKTPSIPSASSYDLHPSSARSSPRYSQVPHELQALESAVSPSGLSSFRIGSLNLKELHRDELAALIRELDEHETVVKQLLGEHWAQYMARFSPGKSREGALESDWAISHTNIASDQQRSIANPRYLTRLARGDFESVFGSSLHVRTASRAPNTVASQSPSSISPQPPHLGDKYASHDGPRVGPRAADTAGGSDSSSRLTSPGAGNAPAATPASATGMGSPILPNSPAPRNIHQASLTQPWPSPPAQRRGPMHNVRVARTARPSCAAAAASGVFSGAAVVNPTFIPSDVRGGPTSIIWTLRFPKESDRSHPKCNPYPEPQPTVREDSFRTACLFKQLLSPPSQPSS